MFPLSAANHIPVRLGFISLVDCAPIVAAQHFGIFQEFGLSVRLSRELGWASIRDKLAFGELDAAHALGAMPLAAALKAPGMPAPVGATSLILNIHGNAITLSQRLFEEGVRDREDLRSYARSLPKSRRLVFGMVFPSSSHHFLLRQWLHSAGIDPDRDVRIVVVPPQQVFRNLQAGTIDGYCAGEPWNTLAVQAGIGWCPEVSARIAPGHPEKGLVCGEHFLTRHPDEAVRLTAAVLKGCRLCDDPQRRRELLPLLAVEERLNCAESAISASLIGPFSLYKGQSCTVDRFHGFAGDDVNRPRREHAQWFFDGLMEAGLLDKYTVADEAVFECVYREDIYAAAVKALA